MISCKPHYRLALSLLSALLLFTGRSIFAQETNEAAAAAEETSAAAESASSLTQSIDAFFGAIVGAMAKVLFVNVGGVPLIIIILVSGGIFFTFCYRFINIRLFKHAIACVRGKYDDPDDEGEISHFKALTSALSATVGLGNIAGVAVAIAAGGPGAIFWMWLVAFFGMTSKFSSCTLAQLYRRIGDDGRVMGGPMVYLDDGIKARAPSLAFLGKFFGILFAILCIGGSLGGGNLFQGKMTYAIAANVIPSLDGPVSPYIFGIVMAVLVGLVIIGGIKRIGEVTSKLVPAMCIFYCVVCLIIIFANFGKLPSLFGSIFSQAFSPQAAFGGFIGVLVQGMKRAAFSNEAGLGSAAIAHAAAKTKEPVREGIVAMIGPFIDTIVVCTMTALAILITGVNEGITDINWVDGAVMTATAFGTVHHVFKLLLVPAVAIFAFSTMISWSYYGERCSEYLFGKRGILPYRIFYTVAVVFGPVMSLNSILDFSDMMLLSMAFPNIIGSIILTPALLPVVKDYVARYKSGEMKTYS
jgi:AGCS family alanine or glycine:cation symporter